MRVLVIEDDRTIADFLKSHLSECSFSVDVARTGASALSLIGTNEYDLVILDLNLPDMHGETVCAKLRQAAHHVPILVVSVIAGTAEKVRLLNAGADDYLVKPFSFDELVARMRALLRRSGEVVPDVIMIGDLELDACRHAVSRRGKPIHFTCKEFAILEYLMRSRGAMVPKTALIEHAWDSSIDPFSATLETHMTNIRKKLGEPALIRTVHGRGYRID